MDKKVLDSFNELKTILPQYTDKPDYDLNLLQRIKDYVNNLEDKLRRRNAQIKNLTTKLNWCREQLFQQGIRTDFGR